jgi:hypothetical protein
MRRQDVVVRICVRMPGSTTSRASRHDAIQPARSLAVSGLRLVISSSRTVALSMDARPELHAERATVTDARRGPAGYSALAAVRHATVDEVGAGHWRPESRKDRPGGARRPTHSRISTCGSHRVWTAGRADDLRLSGVRTSARGRAFRGRLPRPSGADHRPAAYPILIGTGILASSTAPSGASCPSNWTSTSVEPGRSDPEPRVDGKHVSQMYRFASFQPVRLVSTGLNR